MLKHIEHILDTIGAVAVLALCLLICSSIVTREFLGFGVPDSIIFVRELMVLAILFPISAATSRRGHVAIDVIANHFPDSLNRWIAVVAALLGILTVSTLLWAGWLDFAKQFSRGSHYGGDLDFPKWPSRFAFVIAFAFVDIRLFQIFWVDLKAAITGTAAPATV